MDSKKIMNKTIENILDNFVFHGASSAGIMIFQAEKLILYKSTCEEWYDFYNNAKEKSNCHLIKNSMKIATKLSKNMILNKSFSLIWDLQIPSNDESLYLNEYREKYNHCHGINIISLPQDDILIGLTLTGRQCDLNFAQDVIANKSKVSHDAKILQNITRLCWQKHDKI